MKKLILVVTLAITLGACRFTVDNAPPIYVQDKQPNTQISTALHYYEDHCFEDPYNHSAEWCDWYDDNTTCCVWFSDGWYEEYCQWGYDYCWDYNGSF